MTRFTPAYDPDQRVWYVRDARYPDDMSEPCDCRADAEAACEYAEAEQ